MRPLTRRQYTPAAVPGSSGFAPVLASSLIGPAFLLVAVAVAGGIFFRRAQQLYRFVRLGQPVDRLDDSPERVAEEATVVLAQRKLLQRPGPGLMHALIFWGFIVLLTTIVEAFAEVFQPSFAIPLFGRSAWLGLVQDAFSVLVIIAIGMALYYRKVQRPERFKGSHLEEADFILAMIFGIMLTLLFLNAARIALGINESPAAWTPVSNAIAPLFRHMGHDAQGFFERLFLWAHILLILGFLAYIPYSKHLHIFVSEPNVFFANTKARGRLRPLHIDLDQLDSGDVRLGAATVEDLTWKELLDLYSCTECGRCQSVCPAWNTGKPLSPKLIVMNLRDHLFEVGPGLVAARRAGQETEKQPLNPDVVEDEVVWDCVTCGACMQECPVDIEHIDHIVDMRRNLVMGESRFPAEAGTLLRNLESSSNPWGQPQSARADWAKDLEVPVLEDGQAPEYLYWVGCAGSFDDRAKKISQAVVRVLQRAGVPFAILGPRRPGPSHRQRVPLPGAGQSERQDADRDRRQEDRGQLPPLLQHDQERVPGLRRAVRGRPSHGAVRIPDQAGPPTADRRGPGAPRLPRPLLSGQAQRHLRRAPERPRSDPRPLVGGAPPPPGAFVLLWGRRGQDVAGGTPGQADQPRTNRGSHLDRGERNGGGLPVLPDHARRRGAGKGRGHQGPRRGPGPRSGHRCWCRRGAATGCRALDPLRARSRPTAVEEEGLAPGKAPALRRWAFRPIHRAWDSGP